MKTRLDTLGPAAGPPKAKVAAPPLPKPPLADPGVKPPEPKRGGRKMMIRHIAD